MKKASVEQGCNFEDPSGVSKCVLEGANLKGACLEGSNMAGVNLRVANLKNANLKNCNLRAAILAGADLEVVQSRTLWSTICQNAQFISEVQSVRQ